MNKPAILMFGAGGHASVLADILMKQGQPLTAVFSPQSIQRQALIGITHYKDDQDVTLFNPEDCQVVIGIGPQPYGDSRSKLASNLQSRGYRFATVIADSAEVSTYASVQLGGQVLSGAIINAGARIEQHVVVNTRAVIEHDCKVASFSHIAPGAVLLGGAEIGPHAYIGAGATVLPSVKVGAGAVVGAGALVDRDVESNTVVYGARAKQK